MSFAVRFRRELAAGVCVGVSLPEGGGVRAAVRAAPRRGGVRARVAGAARRASFIGGRVALRAALAALGADAGSGPSPILSTPRGAPALPAGFVGSVSHKRELAVAIVGARGRPTPRTTLGIDVEIPRAAAHRHRDARADRRPNARRWPALTRRRATRRCCFASRRRRRSTRRSIRGCSAWSRFRRSRSSTTPDGGRHARLALARGEGPFRVDLYDIASRVDGAGDDLVLVVADQSRRKRNKRALASEL